MIVLVLIAVLLVVGHSNTASVALSGPAAAHVAQSFGYIDGSDQFLATQSISEAIVNVHNAMEYDTLVLRIFETVLARMALTPSDWLSTEETATFATVGQWVLRCDDPSDSLGGVCPTNVSFGVVASVIRFSNVHASAETSVRISRLAEIFRAVSLSLPDAQYLAEKVIGVKIANGSFCARIWLSMIDSALRWPCDTSLALPCVCDFEANSLNHMHPSVYSEWIFTPRFLTFDAAWTQYYAYVTCNGFGWSNSEWDRTVIDVAEKLAKQHISYNETIVLLHMKTPQMCLLLRDIVHWAVSQSNPEPAHLSFNYAVYQAARGVRLASTVNGYSQTRETPIAPGATLNDCVNHETFPALADGLFAMYPLGIPSELLQRLLNTFTPFACKYLSVPVAYHISNAAFASLPLWRSSRALYSSGILRSRNHFALCAASVGAYTNTTPAVAYLAQVLAYDVYWQPLRAQSSIDSVTLSDVLRRLVPASEHRSEAFAVIKVAASAFGYGNELTFHRVYLLVFLRHFIVEQLVTRPVDNVRLPWFIDVPLPRILLRAAVVLGHGEKSVSALMALALCFFSYQCLVRCSSMATMRRNTDTVLKEQLRSWFGVLPTSFADFLTRMTPDGNVLLVTIFAANLAMYLFRDRDNGEPDAQLAIAHIINLSDVSDCGCAGRDEPYSPDRVKTQAAAFGNARSADHVSTEHIVVAEAENIEQRTVSEHLLGDEDHVASNTILATGLGSYLSSAATRDADSADVSLPSSETAPSLWSLSAWLGTSIFDGRSSSSQQLRNVEHRLDRSNDPNVSDYVETDGNDRSCFVPSEPLHSNPTALSVSQKRKSLIKRAIKPLSRSLRASFKAFASIRSRDDSGDAVMSAIPVVTLEPVIIASPVEMSVDEHCLEFLFLDIVLPKSKKINKAWISRWAHFFNFSSHNISTIVAAIPSDHISIPRRDAILAIYKAILSLPTRTTLIAENITVISS